MPERIWLVNAPTHRWQVVALPRGQSAGSNKDRKAAERAAVEQNRFHGGEWGVKDTKTGKIVFRKNPSKRRKAVAKRKQVRRVKRRRSAAQVAAFRKMIAARKQAVAPRARRTRAASTVGGSVARRKSKSRKRRSGGRIKSVRRVGGAAVARTSWRASGYRRNPRRHRRHHYRRNPGFSVGGIVSSVKQGVMDAAFILGGKAGTRFVSNFAPAGLKDTPVKVAAVQVLAAIGLGIVGRRFLGGDKARFIVAGGVVGAIESYINNDATLKASAVGQLLGDDALELGEYVGNGGDGYSTSLNAYEAAAIAGPGSRSLQAYEH